MTPSSPNIVPPHPNSAVRNKPALLRRAPLCSKTVKLCNDDNRPRLLFLRPGGDSDDSVKVAEETGHVDPLLLQLSGPLQAEGLRRTDRF